MDVNNIPDNACSAPQAFNATCNDTCGWDTAALSCQPLSCQPYMTYTQDPNINSSKLALRTAPKQIVSVPCKTGFRAGSALPNASRSFDVMCSSDCTYSAGLACTRVTCGILELPAVSLPYSPAEYLPTTFDFREQMLTGGRYSIMPYANIERQQHFHGDSVLVHCAPGTRINNMTDCGPSATSFMVPCWDGVYRQVRFVERETPVCAV